MDPDFGFLTYDPQRDFHFPRSYIKTLVVKASNATVTYVSGLLTIYWPSPDNLIEVVVFRDYWNPWSSNCYTLGGVIASLSYFLVATPTVINPAGGVLSFRVTGDPPTLSLVFDPVYQNAGEFRFTLPPSPAGWWSG